MEVIRLTTQYLFRCYHTGFIGTSQYSPYYGISGFPNEISYTDWLCSLPETLSDLAGVATVQAYGDAIMLLDMAIVAVVVWLVDDEKGIDEETPVLVLHPFRSRAVPEFLTYNGPGTTDNYEILLSYAMYQTHEYPFKLFRRGRGAYFQSYNLSSAPAGPSVAFRGASKFDVAVIARQCKSGRCKLQFMKRAVGSDDTFTSRRGTIVLNAEGTLARLRFPLWQALMANQKYQHSGWSLLRDGRIEEGRVALSKRVLSGVSELAQQRRMFVRRTRSVNVTISAWYLVVRQLMDFLWDNENDPTVIERAWAANAEGTRFIYCRQVATYEIRSAMERVCEWVNLVGIAQGQESLLCFRRGSTGAERSDEFARLKELLRLENGNISRWAVKGETKQLNIFRNLIDLTAGVLKDVYDYEDKMTQWDEATSRGEHPSTVETGLAYRKMHEDFSKGWDELTAEVLGILNLVFSWQFAWDVFERSRAATKEETIRRPKPPARRVDLYSPFVERVPQRQRMPDLQGRFATDRPKMAPFRMVSIKQPESGEKEAEEEEKRRRDEQATREFFDELEGKERAEKEARYEARARQIEKLRADWHAEHVPDPLDPWDYRNFTSKEWLQSQLEPQDRLEFLNNMVRLPGEVEALKMLSGRGNKVSATDVKKGLAKRPGKELVKSIDAKRAAIAWPVVRRFVVEYVKETGKETAKEVVQNWLYDQVTTFTDRLEASDVKYDDRMFWPLDFPQIGDQVNDDGTINDP